MKCQKTSSGQLGELLMSFYENLDVRAKPMAAHSVRMMCKIMMVESVGKGKTDKIFATSTNINP